MCIRMHMSTVAHELNLIMQQVTSHLIEVRQFFFEVAGYSGFFSKSPKRTSVLDRVVAQTSKSKCVVRWNYHSRAVNTVFEHKDDLLQCFENIRDRQV